MANHRATSPLTQEQLAVLLDRLSAVMQEAERLRIQISNQLIEQGARQQQRISPVRRKAATRKRR